MQTWPEPWIGVAGIVLAGFVIWLALRSWQRHEDMGDHEGRPGSKPKRGNIPPICPLCDCAMAPRGYGMYQCPVCLLQKVVHGDHS